MFDEGQSCKDSPINCFCIIADINNFISLFQASKLGLSKNKSIVCFFASYQVSYIYERQNKSDFIFVISELDMDYWLSKCSCGLVSVREIKSHIYDKWQTSDSSWEFLRGENKQRKTVHDNS